MTEADSSSLGTTSTVFPTGTVPMKLKLAARRWYPIS